MTQHPVNRQTPANHQTQRQRQWNQRNAAPDHRLRQRIEKQRQRHPRQTQRLQQTQDEFTAIVHHHEIVKVEQIERRETEDRRQRAFVKASALDQRVFRI